MIRTLTSTSSTSLGDPKLSMQPQYINLNNLGGLSGLTHIKHFVGMG